MTSLDTRSDRDLLHDAAAPADSFAVFYRRHSEAIIRFAASRGLDAESAADVVAETFMSALRHRRTFRDDARDSARPWLLGIAIRKIADLHRNTSRQRRRQERMKQLLGPLTHEDLAGYDEVLSTSSALDALADLPEIQRAAVLARIVHEREYREVAQALGLTEAAARKHVSRGLALLRLQKGKAR